MDHSHLNPQLETLNWEEEEPLKCDIKMEDPDDPGLETDFRNSFDALNSDVKKSTSAAHKNNMKFILTEMKIETRQDDVRQPGENDINKRSHVSKKQLVTIKCPGCKRIFSKNYWGLVDMSHHIMSSHRQNMRNYVFSTKMKYGCPQKSYTFRRRMKREDK
ncbi:uncharacterized protein LOC117653651 [Thrips palmi]|uniref:Uncharacterized protein LOC117653651 n=1 Tax=Thrips palmi TaxID=161013 RepID=A0A6P9AIU0_THRPL|nr:uncharacterized protein LOC117653651 [Thrips palmi]